MLTIASTEYRSAGHQQQPRKLFATYLRNNHKN